MNLSSHYYCYHHSQKPQGFLIGCIQTTIFYSFLFGHSLKNSGLYEYWAISYVKQLFRVRDLSNGSLPGSRNGKCHRFGSECWDTLNEVFRALALAGFLGFIERHWGSWRRPAAKMALEHAFLSSSVHEN